MPFDATEGFVPSPEPQVVRDLKDARRYVERGWTKFVLWPLKEIDLDPQDHSKYCARGAIYATLGYRPGNRITPAMVDRHMTIERFLLQAVQRRSLPYESVPEWNNSFWMTRKKVLAGFDKAIALAQEHYDRMNLEGTIGKAPEPGC